MTPRVILPERCYAGYIFDLDGTLVDSMPVHYHAWRWAFQRYNAPAEVFRWNEYMAHGGMAAPDIVNSMNERYGLTLPPQELARVKRERYAWLLENQRLPVIEETVALVRRLRAQGIPCSIGTGSWPDGAMATLRSAGIEGLFETIVTPVDVKHGKPAPDIFLLCAERMGVAPQDCVVFEDADPGIAAAEAAGMDCVRVGPTPPVED